MLHVAVLICSDPECAARVEEVASLEELETWVCDCGCGMLVLGWPEPIGAGAEAEDGELVAA